MSVIAARSVPARPEPTELFARAQAIAKLCRARADRTEAERRISAEIVDEIRRADLHRVMQPQMFGGFEYNFDVFAEVNATLSRGCGSTGWVYGLLASHQWLARATEYSPGRSPVSRNRSSMPCMRSVISPTSSRNTVP